MSVEYTKYLVEHINNVNKAANWMNEHDIFDKRYQIRNHDDSKYSSEEYDAYDAYFYGGSDKSQEEVNKEFDYAWLHHIHNNPHHWQHWVLNEDEGSSKVLEMPTSYVFEMIADWWSFSWTSGNLYEVFDWYDKHKDMKLHPNTRKLVEDTLAKIKAELDSGEQEPKEYSLLEKE